MSSVPPEEEEKKLDDLFAALAADNEETKISEAVEPQEEEPAVFIAPILEQDTDISKYLLEEEDITPFEMVENAESAFEESTIDETPILAPSIDELRDSGMVQDERIGKAPSHTLVQVDEDGDPLVDRARMVFVDETTCIGCTNCACIAPQTFMMEDTHGRARAVRQDGDTEETIEEAIATCPVDCIHWVPWDELITLESQREQVMPNYNFKGRLVGNDGLLSTNGAGIALLDISTNKALRCSNCPTNKCPDCPMFSVGDESAMNSIKDGKQRKRCGNCPTNGCPGCPLAADNPEFQKRRARRDIKRRQRIKNRQQDIRRDLGGKSQSVDL